mgnify:CR=1 FL=1
MSPMAAALVSVDVIAGQSVDKNDIIAVIESMKMQTAITASVAGLITDIKVTAGQTIQEGQLICKVVESSQSSDVSDTQQPISDLSLIHI